MDSLCGETGWSFRTYFSTVQFNANATPGVFHDRPLSRTFHLRATVYFHFIRPSTSSRTLDFLFQKREDPIFETYKKVKATEDRLNEELRSGFYILTTPMTSM